MKFESPSKWHSCEGFNLEHGRIWGSRETKTKHTEASRVSGGGERAARCAACGSRTSVVGATSYEFCISFLYSWIDVLDLKQRWWNLKALQNETHMRASILNTGGYGAPGERGLSTPRHLGWVGGGGERTARCAARVSRASVVGTTGRVGIVVGKIYSLLASFDDRLEQVTHTKHSKSPSDLEARFILGGRPTL